MYKLLINCPAGEQQIIQVGEGGNYFDSSRVVWDERMDGDLPNVTLGKMQRNGKELDTLSDYLPEHAEFLARKQIKIDEQIKKSQLETDTKVDGDLATLRSMSGTEIDDWFVTNITNISQASKLLKKIVKSLVRQGVL